jgi:uncharacterized protein (DUF934 family)
MPLIKENQLISNDPWQLITDAEEQTSGANLILPLDAWNAADGAQYGVWLDSDQSPEQLQRPLADAALIAINFPVFSDGRGYSYARTLRQQLGFDGEIRAIGDVLIDQLHYLRRCGFSSFDLRDDQESAVALEALQSFSVAYQGSTDEALPAFRRRG